MINRYYNSYWIVSKFLNRAYLIRLILISISLEQTLAQIQSLTTHEHFSENYTLVLKQISLLLETLPELLILKGKLLEQEIK